MSMNFVPRSTPVLYHPLWKIFKRRKRINKPFSRVLYTRETIQILENLFHFFTVPLVKTSAVGDIEHGGTSIPAMVHKEMFWFIHHLDTKLLCFKQFNRFITLSGFRHKHF